MENRHDKLLNLVNHRFTSLTNNHTADAQFKFKRRWCGTIRISYILKKLPAFQLAFFLFLFKIIRPPKVILLSALLYMFSIKLQS